MAAFGAENEPLASLLSAARVGDDASLWRLGEALRPRLRAAVGRQVATAQAKVDASDVVQESLLAAFQAFRSFQGRTLSDWEAWLTAIVRNQTLNAIRFWKHQCRDARLERPLTTDQGGEQPLWDQDLSPSQQVINRETAERLGRLVTELPLAERSAIRMRYLDNAPIAAIAGELGRTDAAVAGLLKRGLRRLRAAAGEASDDGSA